MKSIKKEDFTKKYKGIFFDMDGVLYDSMGYHAEAWSKAFRFFGVDFTREMVYLNEGRTASSTVDLIYLEKYGRRATSEEVEEIYKKKTEIILDYPEPEPFKGAIRLMELAMIHGMTVWVVTGSAQEKYLEALLEDFQGFVALERVVSGKDVKKGKPHPEPYLTALAKSGLKAEEVVVVENAPLGIQSAKAAGLYTIAVNTGILKDQVLWDSGADIVVKDLSQLFDNQ